MKRQDNEALLQKLNDRLQSYPNFKKSKFGSKTEFTVVHFAGEVKYNVENFLQKNIDNVSDSVIQLIQAMNILGQDQSNNSTETIQ